MAWEDCLAYWWNPIAFTACVGLDAGGVIDVPAVGEVSLIWLIIAILIIVVVAAVVL